MTPDEIREAHDLLATLDNLTATLAAVAAGHQVEICVQALEPDEDADPADPTPEMVVGPAWSSGAFEITEPVSVQLRQILLAAASPVRERLIALGVDDRSAP